MSGIMVFRDVIAMISTLTAKDAATCETFLSEFFALLSEQLAKGETVQIKHFGTFSVTKDGTVVLSADKEVADALNAAFECFEPVEIKDGLSDSELETNSEHDRLQPPPVPVCDRKVEVAPVSEKIESEVAPNSTPNVMTESPGMPPESVPSVKEEPEETRGNISLEECNSDDSNFDAIEGITVRKSRFWVGYACGVATAMIIGLVVYFLPRVVNFSEEKQEQRLLELQDSINQARARLLKIDLQEQSLDTLQKSSLNKSQNRNNAAEDAATGKKELAKYKVTSSTHLSSLARKYYGHYSFWVYIYLENKSKIKNPDNLPVGVTLIIPLPQKYGINSRDPESIRKAKALEKEIKSRS